MIGWVDIETTGFSPRSHSLLEVCLVVTDDDLNVVRSSSVVLKHVRESLRFQSPVVEKMHSDNGLLSEICSPLALHERDAEKTLIECLADAKGSPMAGSSIWFDRSFLRWTMPDFEELFYYRNIDVSSITELVKRWRPDAYERYGLLPRSHEHRAMPDVLASISLARFFRKELFLPIQ